MMLSSWIAGALNDWLKSMKVGNPPVVSAFNLCIVVVGASAKNLNSLQLRDFSRSACVFGMRPLNSASRELFASPTRKSNRNASITTRTTFGGRCLTQQYSTSASGSSPYLRMSSQVFRWSSSFLVSRKPEEKRDRSIRTRNLVRSHSVRGSLHIALSSIGRSRSQLVGHGPRQDRLSVPLLGKSGERAAFLWCRPCQEG
mmetsp:Transcript_10199/g.62186  ORF Transcript_10199/g.62186 Transcript_10199/m.62186 type:complete len:200 (-) Transcript_10199:1429-2028(-)